MLVLRKILRTHEIDDDPTDEDNIIDMIELSVLQFMSLQYVVLSLKNFTTENIVKIAFLLPVRFSSLRILRLILVNTKELCNDYLRLKTSVLIKISNLTEMQAFFRPRNCNTLRQRNVGSVLINRSREHILEMGSVRKNLYFLFTPSPFRRKPFLGYSFLLRQDYFQSPGLPRLTPVTVCSKSLPLFENKHPIILVLHLC